MLHRKTIKSLSSSPWTAKLLQKLGKQAGNSAFKHQGKLFQGHGAQCQHPGTLGTVSLPALAPNRHTGPCSWQQHPLKSGHQGNSLNSELHQAVVMHSQHVKELSRDQAAPATQYLDFFFPLFTCSQINSNFFLITISRGSKKQNLKTFLFVSQDNWKGARELG